MKFQYVTQVFVSEMKNRMQSLSNGLLTLLLSGGVLMACQADDRAIQPPASSRVAGVIPAAQSSTKAKPANFKSNYLMGKFDPAKSPQFAKIPKKYADRSGLYLRKEALNDFIKMHAAAKRSGVHLQIRSATRNFNNQKNIWERKWLGKKRLSDGTNIKKIKDPTMKALKILEYSAMPGTSRHHWGSDIDLNAFNNKWFESGKGLKLFKWMSANAAKFGFCRPYTAGRQTGYKEEKWHWSYMPLAKPLIKEVPMVLNDQLIGGFLGSDTAAGIGVVNNYILGVNAHCK